MKYNIDKYIVRKEVSINDALIALNALSDDILAVFVVDENLKLLGSVTDGDMRRALIRGCHLNDSITFAMNPHYHAIRIGHFSVSELKDLKQKHIALVPYLNEEGQIVKVYNLLKYESILPIDAILMAGGKGLRLRPLTETTPKPLLKVGEKPIIDYNLERLINYGIDNLFVTVNYLKEQIEEHIRNFKSEATISCVREPQYLGTIGSVLFVEGLQHDSVLVMNSDLFTNINYEDFYLHFMNHNADMSVAAVSYSITVPYGIFDLDGRNIKGIKEKPTFNYYANAGIYLIKRSLLSLIPKDTFFDATDFMNMLIEKGYKVIRYPITGYWLDIGKFEDFNKAKELVNHI